jgi:hypothetical protein
VDPVRYQYRVEFEDDRGRKQTQVVYPLDWPGYDPEPDHQTRTRADHLTSTLKDRGFRILSQARKPWPPTP